MDDSIPRLDGETEMEWRARLVREARPGFHAQCEQEVRDAADQLSEQDLEIVRVAISRFAGSSTDPRRALCDNLCRGLSRIASIELAAQAVGGRVVADGLPALASGLPTSFTRTDRRMEVFGISPEALAAEWREAQVAGVGARLPDMTLAVLIPPVMWPSIAAVVNEGPDGLDRRLRAVIDLRARSGVSLGGIVTSDVDPVVRLANAVVTLNSLGHPAAPLHEWRAKFMAPDVSQVADPADTDRQAPPRDLVRPTMKHLWATMERETRHGTVVPRNKWRALRLFVFVSIMLTTGTRVGALRSMRICDYEREHVFPDTHVGPAIALAIGKQRRHGATRRWKAIPPQLAPYLEIYMEATRTHAQPATWPMWPSYRYAARPPLNEEDIPHAWSPGRALRGRRDEYERGLERARARARDTAEAAGLSLADVEAAVARAETHAGCPLFVRPGGEGPWDGYVPHAMRAYAYQALARAGAHLLDTREGAGLLGGSIDQYAMARSVLDQAPGTADLLGYGAASKPQARETLSRLLVPLVWEFMIGELGAPVGIDHTRVREIRARIREISEQEEILYRMLDKVDQETRDARARAQRRQTGRRLRNFAHLSRDEMWSHIQDAQADLLATLDDIDATASRQRSDLQRQLRAIARARQEAEADLAAAETTEVPLLDAEPSGAWVPGTHTPRVRPFESPEDEEPDHAEENDGLLEPVRSLLWPSEVAELLGKSPAQMTRWLDPAYLANARRTHGVPWTADDIREGRVLVVESARRRLIRAEGIDRDSLSVDQQQRLALLLARPLPARART